MKKQKKTRNPYAKNLADPKYRQQVKGPKKKKLIDDLRVKELEEEMHEEVSEEVETA